MEEFLKAVSNFGFPIVVAAYLLIRMEKTIGKLSNDVRELKDSIISLTTNLRK